MNPSHEAIPGCPATPHSIPNLAPDERCSRSLPRNNAAQLTGADASCGHAGQALHPLTLKPRPRKVAAEAEQGGVAAKASEGRTSAEATEHPQVVALTTSKAPSGPSSRPSSFRRQHSFMADDELSWADSANSSSTTTSSAHCCVCNESYGSDEIAPGNRRRRSRLFDKYSGAPFPRATYVPMVGLTTLAALLFAVSVVVRTKGRSLQLPTMQYTDEGIQERALRWAAATNTGDVLIQQETLAEPPTTRVSRGRLQVKFFKGRVEGEVTVSSSTAGVQISRHHVSKMASRKRKSQKVLSGTLHAKDDDEKAREANLVTLFPFGRPPPCGAAYYTFCERPPREYHYRRAVNACVETDAVDAADVCNRGTNRFSSLDHCLKSCVSAEYPAEECFKRPLFTRCTRQDALSRWWHFEGKKCVAWTFPSGGCPANGSKVFTTAHECEKHCRHHGARCRRPEVVACGRRHLKYPYFAHVYAQEGRGEQYFFDKILKAVGELAKGVGNVVQGAAEGIGNAVNALTFSDTKGVVTTKAADILHKLVIGPHLVPEKYETLDVLVNKEAQRVGVEAIQLGGVLRAIEHGLRATAQYQQGAESQGQQYFFDKIFKAKGELVKGIGKVVEGAAKGVSNAVNALTFSDTKGVVTTKAADILRKLVIKDLSLLLAKTARYDEAKIFTFFLIGCVAFCDPSFSPNDPEAGCSYSSLVEVSTLVLHFLVVVPYKEHGHMMVSGDNGLRPVLAPLGSLPLPSLKRPADIRPRNDQSRSLGVEAIQVGEVLRAISQKIRMICNNQSKQST
ncbi:uncharacterized protein LOC119375942, partial [Rhipicephalus sanguineus]|uniref:uncharacterized protein LOC119375942 n=1 Tax=Rhipicephalus sanguineus TaxID=34632 RepID=UPI0020C4DA57